MSALSFDKIGRAVCFMLLVPAILAFAAVFFGYPVKWLWNYLMPDMFGLKPITFPQAVGLMFLCGMLFGQSKSKEQK